MYGDLYVYVCLSCSGLVVVYEFRLDVIYLLYDDSLERRTAIGDVQSRESGAAALLPDTTTTTIHGTATGQVLPWRCQP